MRAGPDVAAKVDPPQPRAVDLVGIDQLTAGQARGGVVARIRRIPFDDDLVLAIAVEIGSARVVGAVGEGAGRRTGPALRRCRRRAGRAARSGIAVSARWRAARTARWPRARCPAEPAGRCRVGLGQIGRGVDQVGRRHERASIQLHRRARSAGAIHVEGDVRRVGPEQPPSHVDRALAGANGDDAASEVLDGVLSGCGGRKRDTRR